MAKLYIANESFTTVLHGEQILVLEKQTVTEEGSELLRNHPGQFNELRVHYPAKPEIEQATAAPGEKRR